MRAFDRHSTETQLDLAVSLEQGGFLTGVCRDGKEKVPAQLHAHEHLWHFMWHRMSSAFFRDRKAVCVIAW